MLLSIIIPVYNVEHYVDRCIKSILSQNYLEYEIIAVNDASTDNSLSKLLYWESVSDKITVVNKESNTGLSDTRNKGLSVAKGDYILFVDSDDYLERNSLGELTSELKIHNPEILYFGYVLERENTKALTYSYKCEKDKLYLDSSFIREELRNRNIPIPACFACYNANFIISNKLLFEVGILHEDVLWSPQVVYKSQRVYTSSLCVYHYVLRHNSISQKKSIKNGTDLLYICERLDTFSKGISDQEIKKMFINYIAMTYMKTVAVNSLAYNSTVKIERFYPLKRVCFFKDFCKASVFSINPRLYTKIYMFVKKTIGREVL